MENKCVANNGGDLPRKEKVTELGLVVRAVDGRLYYEIKYKKVGENHYRIGYSSYSFENVLHWKDECFEVVAKPQTNGDRIRNMSDEDLADLLEAVNYEGMKGLDADWPCDDCEKVLACEFCFKKWLQKESEEGI